MASEEVAEEGLGGAEDQVLKLLHQGHEVPQGLGAGKGPGRLLQGLPGRKPLLLGEELHPGPGGRADAPRGVFRTRFRLTASRG